jgi:hypothetical protein
VGRDSGRCLSFWLSCRSGFPVSGRSGFPVSGCSGLPVSGRSGFPVSGRSGFPVSGRSVFPASGRSGFPVSGRSGFPVVPAFQSFYGYCSKNKLKKEKRAVHYNAQRSAYLLRNRLFILLLQAEMEIDFSYKNGMFKWQLNQDRCGRDFFLTFTIFPTRFILLVTNYF